jgi:hypothetical protein
MPIVLVEPTGSTKRASGAKSKVRIPITHKGSLAKYGYSLKKSKLARHRALSKAVRLYGPSKTIKKVNALSIYNKKHHKTASKKAHSDVKYIEEKME